MTEAYSARNKGSGKIPPDAHARWLADSRPFAPWHYKKDAMLHDGTGRLVSSTSCAWTTPHRHRLIGNGSTGASRPGS